MKSFLRSLYLGIAVCFVINLPIICSIVVAKIILRLLNISTFSAWVILSIGFSLLAIGKVTQMVEKWQNGPF